MKRFITYTLLTGMIVLTDQLSTVKHLFYSCSKKEKRLAELSVNILSDCEQ